MSKNISKQLSYIKNKDDEYDNTFSFNEIYYHKILLSSITCVCLQNLYWKTYTFPIMERIDRNIIKDYLRELNV